MICYLVPRFAALKEHRELLVEHPLELVGRHVGHAPVCLHGLQLVQAPVQLLQGLNSQADITTFL